jgi:nitrate reductase gamma subunit
MAILPVWAYLTLVGFVLGCAYKAYHYATMPMHVRWELYPVAHEKGKVSYGGSYFEELDWWTKPREISRLGEIKTIAEEVLTLKAVRENNPSLWLPSLLFHFGLYLLFGLGAALVAGGAARYIEMPGLTFLGGGPLLSAWGAVALALATVGCAGLLLRRLGNRRLRNASTPADFLHLWLLLAVFCASWGSWLRADREYTMAAGFVGGLVTLRPVAAGSGWFVAQVVLLGVFLAYLPWSHMTHMFAKYFTWHSVRWDDTPNLGGEVYQARVQKLLMLPISWSAPHIKGGGGKRWADVVQEKGES